MKYTLTETNQTNSSWLALLLFWDKRKGSNTRATSASSSINKYVHEQLCGCTVKYRLKVRL